MKARIVKNGDIFTLLLSCGKIKKLRKEEIKDYILSFDSLEHYASNPESDFFANNISKYQGETLAYVNDEFELVISNSNFIKELFFERSIDYLTANEYALVHNKKDGVIKRLCRDGRIPRAIKKGSQWLIPKDAPYPQDARIGSRLNINK